MTSFLLCATPASGHVTRIAEVARHLVAKGHRVRILTGTRFRDAVRATGAEFLPLPPGADIDLDDPWRQFPEGRLKTGMGSLRFNIAELFVKPMGAQVAAIDAAARAEPIDTIIAEGTFAGASVIASRPHPRPAVVLLGLTPVSAASVDTAPFGFNLPPLAGLPGRLRNRILTAIGDVILIRPIFAAARAPFRAATGQELATDSLDWYQHADLVAQLTVPGFEYPRRDLPSTIRFLGPLVADGTGSAELPDWWDDLDDARAVVHVTQGTVANKDFEQLVLPTVRALAHDDVLVVVTTGGRPVDSLPGNLPSNVRVGSYLPYHLLLPRLDLLVTNGGYGGVQYALAHGVPLVVAGRTEDKGEVCARVAWSGCGIDLRTDRAHDDAVRTAVHTVLAEPAYRTAATRMRDEIAAAPGWSGLDAVLDEALAATLA
jgi:UDP:flavonoid glycosyltransferase YjiC (YdhE family)